MSNQFIEKQVKLLDINKRVRLTKTGMENWFAINLTYLSFFVNMAAIGYCLLSSNTNASLVGLLMNYAINLSSDIIEFTDSVTGFQAKIISLERIYAFMNIEPEPAYLEYCQRWSSQEEGFQLVISKGDIEFKGMCARYRTDLPDVLKGIDLHIKGGEKIGIVGRTGAGKTTIINSLLMITEISKGQLLIDGTPISDYLVKNLRYGVTMIDQEPTLIKSSFKENLDITGKYSEEELY
jgi:ABC-type multidrug transport system fused ATPase/permease subunit